MTRCRVAFDFPRDRHSPARVNQRIKRRLSRERIQPVRYPNAPRVTFEEKRARRLREANYASPGRRCGTAGALFGIEPQAVEVQAVPCPEAAPPACSFKHRELYEAVLAAQAGRTYGAGYSRAQGGPHAADGLAGRLGLKLEAFEELRAAVCEEGGGMTPSTYSYRESDPGKWVVCGPPPDVRRTGCSFGSRRSWTRQMSRLPSTGVPVRRGLWRDQEAKP